MVLYIQPLNAFLFSLYLIVFSYYMSLWEYVLSCGI